MERDCARFIHLSNLFFNSSPAINDNLSFFNNLTFVKLSQLIKLIKLVRNGIKIGTRLCKVHSSMVTGVCEGGDCSVDTIYLTATSSTTTPDCAHGNIRIHGHLMSAIRKRVRKEGFPAGITTDYIGKPWLTGSLTS